MIASWGRAPWRFECEFVAGLSPSVCRDETRRETMGRRSPPEGDLEDASFLGTLCPGNKNMNRVRPSRDPGCQSFCLTLSFMPPAIRGEKTQDTKSACAHVREEGGSGVVVADRPTLAEGRIYLNPLRQTETWCQ